MANLPNWSTVLPEPRVGAPQDSARVAQDNAVYTAPRFATLWHETVATYVTHAGPVIVCAWVGFAALITAIQSFQTLNRLVPVSDLWVFFGGAVVALLLDALAQGALAWIGLHGRDNNTGEVSVVGAMRAARAGWGRLLPGTLLHAMLTFVCALSLTPFLLRSGLMDINLEPIDINPNSLPRLAAARSFDAATLGVLHPFGELIAPVRTVLLPVFQQSEIPDPDLWRAFEISNHVDPSDHREAQPYVVPMAPLPAGLIVLIGLMLLVADALLLRFYAAVAMNMRPRAGVPTGLFGPVLESARLGMRHMRLVFFNPVLLRLVMGALQIACLTLTTSAAETMVFPHLAASSGALWVLPAGRLACIAGSAAVSALLTAFCALYDARLYVALARIDRSADGMKKSEP